MAREDLFKSTALDRIRKELDTVLAQVRTMIERAAVDESMTQDFGAVADQLGQAANVLDVAEYPAVALVMREMELVARALAGGQVSGREYACEALMRTVLQLPGYLDHVRVGNRDIPQVLYPMAAELRAARNGPLLSEGALFFTGDFPEVPIPSVPAEGEPESPDRYARRERARFQTQILALLRARDVPRAAENAAGILRRLWRLSTTSQSRRLWWVAAAWMRSPAHTSGELEVSEKLLLGHVDRRLKTLVERGEAGADPTLDGEIIRAML